MKRNLGFLGSDRGGMTVTLEGLDGDGKSKRFILASGRRPRAWALRSGDRLGAAGQAPARRHLQARGAMPCVGLFTLDEFLAEVGDLDIATGTT